MDLGLADRVYVVTGAARGLGRAVAAALVADGARVVASSRGDQLDRTVAELGDRAVAVRADNGADDTPQRLVTAALDTWGRLDGALISVGGPPPGTLESIGDQQWRDSFETVFLGAVRIARAVAAELGEGGSLAFVLSGSVRSPIADLAVSNGLRPGLAMVAKTMADELGPRGIRVNGLLPTAVRTDRIAELEQASGDAERHRADNLSRIPLRRYGEPEEFGRAAAFLLSPAASYLSGVMLPVDGGATRSL